MAALIILVAGIVLISALRVASDADKHDQIMHDFENEKY